ncbi:phenylalanine--tRNA ligase subunit alpha [Patescibacteria group bacterium]|nr:phenylalanine--tRNA ligase subunit alpha [Patescibacteria group bacterium]
MNLDKRMQTIRDMVEERLRSGDNPARISQDILGRKGEITRLFQAIVALPEHERARYGSAANRLKAEMETVLKTGGSAQAAVFDPTVPANPGRYGTIHPVSQMIEKIVTIFQQLSFDVIEGNELVTEKENFESLNIDKDHPARDSHETFYVKENLLLRTQTSSMQVSEMSRRARLNQLPIRVVAPGKTYRRESDQTHSPMFHQIEGFMVDTQTTFADLKGVLEYVVDRLFEGQVECRFRPHFFPFTEPSGEIDIRWKKGAVGEGKHTGWLELLGCGMIHPLVLKRAGIDPRVYQGWAFGIGIERPIMIGNQVPELRRFFDGSLSLLKQFEAGV